MQNGVQGKTQKLSTRAGGWSTLRGRPQLTAFPGPTGPEISLTRNRVKMRGA